MDTPIARAAEQLAWLTDGWSSIQIETTVNMRNNEASRDDDLFSSSLTTSRYIETADGRRAYEERTAPENGTEITCKYYTDGKQAATIYRGTLPHGREVETVTIRRSFGMDDRGWHHCPEPLKYFYAGLLPLHEALDDAEYLGTSRHLDRECDVFLIDRSAVKSRLDTVYHLDRATSVPLKVSQYKTDDDRTNDRPALDWAATSLDEVDGRPFPLNSEQRVYSTAKPGKPYLEQKIAVASLKFNESYPASTFQPAIGPQAQVVNEITRKFTPAQQREPVPQAEGAASAPIRAVPNRGWPVDAPTLVLSLGLLILMASLFLWWRRS